MNKKKTLLIIGSGIGIVLISLVVVFCLNSSAENKLTCYSNNSSNGVQVEQKYLIGANKDIINDIVVTKKFIYADQARFESFNSIVASGTNTKMSELENEYIKFDSTSKDRTYTTKLEVDAKKADKKKVEELGLSQSLNKLKTTLESQGLTCK